MKKRASVLMLAARPVMIPFVLLLSICSAAEYFLFSAEIQGAGEYPRLGAMLSACHIEKIFAASFILLTVLMVLSGIDMGGRMSYSLQRLRIPEKEILFLWGGYYAICYVILAAWQLGMIFLFTRLCPSLAINQSFMLDCYRVPLLHSLLPLSESSRIVRNLIMAVTLGLSVSIFSYRVRRGGKGVALPLLAALTAVFFSYGMAHWGGDVFLSIIYIGVTAMALFNIPEDTE